MFKDWQRSQKTSLLTRPPLDHYQMSIKEFLIMTKQILENALVLLDSRINILWYVFKKLYYLLTTCRITIVNLLPMQIQMKIIAMLSKA